MIILIIEHHAKHFLLSISDYHFKRMLKTAKVLFSIDRFLYFLPKREFIGLWLNFVDEQYWSTYSMTERQLNILSHILSL